MSDIQRYTNQRDIDNLLSAGNSFVKYDDHIAEVKEHMAIADGHFVNEHNLRMENKELQARIDELEIPVGKSFKVPPEMKNQIKAEGIEEAVAKFKKENEIWRWLPDARGTVNEIMEYANKLRSEG